MTLILIVLVLLLLFGGGGYYIGLPDRGPVYGGSGLGLVLLVILILWALGVFGGRVR